MYTMVYIYIGWINMNAKNGLTNRVCQYAVLGWLLIGELSWKTNYLFGFVLLSISSQSE